MDNTARLTANMAARVIVVTGAKNLLFIVSCVFSLQTKELPKHRRSWNGVAL